MSKYKKIPLPEKGQNAYVIVDEEAEIEGHCFFTDGKEIYENNPDYNPYALHDFLWKLIATYGFHIEGVKEIENESEKLSFDFSYNYKREYDDDFINKICIEKLEFGFKAGYQSHAATHPFSEEDMKMFADKILTEWAGGKTALLALPFYDDEIDKYLFQPRYLSEEEVDKLLKK